MGHTTQGIRNVALVGAAGAGKTLLAESLLLQAGAIRAKGSLARGSTVSDFDPQEKALQHSLDPAILTFDCDSTRIQLLDTPGYPGLSGSHALGAGGRGSRRRRRQRNEPARMPSPGA